MSKNRKQYFFLKKCKEKKGKNLKNITKNKDKKKKW